MKLIRRATTFLFCLGWGLLACVFLPQTIFARSLYYENYDIEIDVNPDSTFTVEETLDMRFEGEYRGVVRGITLSDPQRDLNCIRQNLRCGGFEYIALDGVYDENGTEVPGSDYELGVLEDENTGKRYFQVKWEVWPGGRNHQDYPFKWSLRYKVFGGMNFDDDYGYLYWNATPEDPGGIINATNIQLNLPSLAKGQDLEIYTRDNHDFQVANFGNNVTIEGEKIGYSTGSVTIDYRVPRNAVTEHGTLRLDKSFPLKPLSIAFQGYEFVGVDREFKGLPTGLYDISLSAGGYNTKTVELNVLDGEVVSIDANLSPNILTVLLIIATIFLSIVGLIAIPVGIWYVYNHWRQHGRDKGLSATIIPIYSPPAGLSPYKMGSLKDESVDPEDITGIIIDLAFRGYLKIKEVKEKVNYDLIKTDKPWTELDEIEVELLNYLFKSGNTASTASLKNNFYTKYQLLQKKINRTLLNEGVYESLPSVVKAKYAGYGITYLVVGGLITFVLLIFMTMWIGFPGPFTLSLAMVTTGISYLAVAPFMPAKTAKGSQMLAQTLGFKMYMERAERYRLQGLKPEEFERYLSYAVVFGIERTWADQFKDIYKGQPDWYEGKVDAWDVYMVSRIASNFSSGMRNQVYTTVPSSSASGSGWSGGGSFGGGFSGGGGGGGFSGGF